MKLVIIGGVAGGASAAARARRLNENAEIIIFERGEHISFANCGLPYHIGGTIAERSKLLVQTPQSMKARFNIDVRTRSEVTRIDRGKKEVLVRDLANGREYRQSYDKLILSPGAEPVKPEIAGINSKNVYTLRSLADMDRIKTAADGNPGKRAMIVGAGYIGLEMAEALRQKKMEVTLVEMGTQVFGPIDPEMASAVAGQLRMHGVDLRLGCSATSIEETAQGLRVKLSSGDTIECTMVLMAIGVRPESRLAKEAGLTIGQRGGIVVNKCMQTSDADIYAVGDAVEVEDFVGGFATFIPLAGPANRQGRIAADNIMEGGKCSYHKTQGTAICKVFDLAVGMTGLSEKVLKRLGRPYEKVYVHPASHANYYPGASPLSLKLIFDPNDGKILGAQAVGSEGVDKRIDVISVAMRAGMSVRDLQDLELCYAPPYGSAKDPVNYAGFVATNVLEGKVKICHWEDMLKADDGQVLVDVRTPAETEAGTIGAAVNIPVDQLRDRMGELPKDKELLVFCAVGLRGYIACRMLQQNGFNCRNLSGGYKTFRAAVENKPVERGPEKKDEKNSGGGQSLPSKEKQDMIKISKHIDACGLQCPGPVMQLKNEIEGIQVGQAVTIATRDPGFAADIPAWCKSTGNELAGLVSENGVIKATIIKRAGQASIPGGLNSNKKTLVVFSSDFDRAMASFVIANGAAAMGSEVTMFFTFWGLNVLRKGNGPAVQKSLVERMLGMMMPKGASKLTLSKMNMCGLGTAMMKGIMRKKSVSSLEELLGKARAAGVKLVACSMSMDIMGIKPEELIDGVEIGGVAMYLNEAQGGNVNLFI